MSEDNTSPNETPRSIEEIFAPLGGHRNGCTLAEYLAFARHVREQSPARLLVLGAGYDSKAWIASNHGGTTLVLENNPEWIEKIGAEIKPSALQRINYQQKFEIWQENGFDREAAALPETSPSPFDASWDLAFVDGPWGPTWGRHQSTLGAAQALRPGGLLALHDCERDREQAVCRQLLEPAGFTLEEEVERLRIYRAP